MRPRNILLLYRVRLRARLAHELFAVLGIAVGVALLFASQVMRASPDAAMHELLGDVVGTMRFELSARGPAGFDQRVLGDVQRLPGVRAAIPLFQARANLVGPTGQQQVELISTDARLAHLGGPLLRRFDAATLNRQRVLALPLELADSVGLSSLRPAELQIGGRSVRTFVGAVLFEHNLGVLAHSRFVFAPLAYAQQLARLPGRIAAVLVSPRAGRQRQVKAELEQLSAGRMSVHPADFTATLFDQAAAPSSESAELFSVIGVLVGLLLAVNALTLTAAPRRNLVEDLRLDGYSRRMIVQLLLFDALVLGVCASLLGLVLGDALSLLLFGSNPGYLAYAFPIDAQRVVSWQSVALAAGGGLLAAFAGVLISVPGAVRSGRSRSRTGARWGMRRRVMPGLASALGELACLTTAAVTLLAAPGAAILGIVSLACALLLALPWLVGGCLQAAEAVQRTLGGAAAHLAALELRSPVNRLRTLAIAAAAATAVFGSVAVEGAQSDLQRGLDRAAGEITAPADAWVTAAGTKNVLATETFAPSQLSVLRGLPDVRRVGLLRSGFLDFGTRRVWVLAPPDSTPQPIPPDELVRGDPAAATARLHHGGWVVVSQKLAAEHHLRVGKPFVLPAPHPIVVRVAALSNNIGWPPGAIVMRSSDYARAWPGGYASAYEIALRAGVPAQQGVREVRRALALHGGDGLTVESRARRTQRFRAASRQGLSWLTQITNLVLIAAMLAMAGAMGAMIWQRRPQLADMKVDGFHGGVLWRALLLESALVLGAGCTVGALFGLGGQLLLSHALVAATGFPVVESIGSPAALAGLVAVTGVAVAIVAVPGYLATRVRAAIALQD